MKMKKLVPILILLAVLVLSACGNTAAKETEYGIFHSDATAIDFLEGYWTNGRGDYISAGRGNSPLIVWGTNIRVPQAEIFVLTDGVLRGGTNGGESKDIFAFEYIDDNTVSVTDIVHGEQSRFIRDSLETDVTRTDNEYVFWSMNRAYAFLRGMWMDESGSFFTLSANDAGAVLWNSDLEFPECDLIDFCEGDLCAVSYDPNGKKSFTPVYRFDIADESNLTVTRLASGETAHFQRLSREYDGALLDSMYIFSNPQRAFVFLEGTWKSVDGDYFTVSIENGNVVWNTSLELPKYPSYTFAEGGLVGVETPEDGTKSTTFIYTFSISSEDELELSVPDSDIVYTLIRQK